jgi:SAM-dependent methyltransferase
MPISFLADQQLPPIPPTDLIYRVTPAFDADDAEGARQAFNEGGREAVRSLERALASIGRELTSFARILDFGCGPGRIMRHLGPLADGSELHGVDVDGDAIAWCSEQIPFAQFVTGPHEPPLPYADGAFDLVFNHSVFTHIDEARQDLWLAELRRILAPGGIALLTVHSTRQCNFTLANLEERGAAYRERLARDGIVFIDNDAFVGSTHPEWYHSTFHAPWYVHQHWTSFFVLRAYIPEGSDTQDMVVLERPPQPDPMLAPITPAPGAAATASPPPIRVHSVLRRFYRLLRVGQRVAELERSTQMLRVGSYQQGQRTSIVERELRAEIDELRARLRDE